MRPIKEYVPVPELVILVLTGILYLPLLIYIVVANIIDYRILKSFYYSKKQWDLNICCGNKDGGGVNADVEKRNIPNFVLIKNIYKLPFKDQEFENVICSHTMEHVENPDKFYEELKRVSKKVTVLIPPLWDLACLGAFREHKWQFLTVRTNHVNTLPKKFKLPYWSYQRKFDQKISY